MNTLPKVDVLMATYNGAAYLAEQIDSVLAQRDIDLRLILRDDGSSDGTPDIIREYVQRHPGKVILLEDNGDRLGASGNFFRLLQQPSDADFVAFCDQDDVWHDDKLAIAVARLRDEGETAALYCSAVEYVDEAMGHLGFSPSMITPAFPNALAENIAPGCSMVMNTSLHRLVIMHQPTNATIHDWWVYLVAAALGQVIFDPVPRMKYRQHGSNTIGGGYSFYEKWRKRLQRFSAGNAWRMAAQASEFEKLYGSQLTPAQHELIAYFVAGKTSFAARIRFLLGWRVWRQSILETLVVKFLVLINAY